MLTKLSVCFFLLMFSFVSFAQNTILWKVTHTANNKTSYLLGTYHTIGGSFVDSFPVIKEKIRTCNLVVGETDLRRTNLTTFYGSRTTATPLTSVLGVEDSTSLAEVLKKHQPYLNKLTPGEINLFVMMKSRLCPKYNSGDSVLMDDHILNMGAGFGATLYFLETDTLQLQKIYEATKKSDLKDLKVTVPYYLKKMREAQTNDKRCADSDKYAAFEYEYKLSKECPRKGQNEILITDRNATWMQKLPQLLSENNCFIAVGLAHLWYKCGLIEQLKQLGYSVEPVAMK